MKFARLLAVLAACAFTTPALSAVPGWYLGLGVGYDHLDPVSLQQPPGGTNISLRSQDGAIYMGSAGYKFDMGLRTELEFGYTEHDVQSASSGGVTTFPHGGTETLSVLANAIYDYQLSPRWALSFGAGVGMGDVNTYVTCGALKCVQGGKAVLQWQGIVGVSFALAPDVDLYTDFRYRSAEANSNFADPAAGTAIHVGQFPEQVALVGVRWYVGQ